MDKEIFEAFLTAHNWINIKDFLEKPKMELKETVDFYEKVNMEILKFVTDMDSPWDIKINYLRDVLEDYEFKIIRDNTEYFKQFDYVVPSHVALIGDELIITYDCFKKVQINDG
jgi:hypothetical protein